MPVQSDKTGFQCTAIWDGVRCTAMMFVDDTKHPKSDDAPRRYRKCPACSSKQKTKELPDGECIQPAFPIDMKSRRKRKNETISTRDMPGQRLLWEETK